MENEREEQIYEEDLDALHSKVFGNAFGYIAGHTSIQWEPLDNNYVEKCKDEILVNMKKGLRGNVSLLLINC